MPDGIEGAVQFWEMNDHRTPTLEANRSFSELRLQRLQKELEAERALQGYTVCVAGSYGRLEASEYSDLDFFVLSEQGAEVADLSGPHQAVENVARGLGFPGSNPTGVFKSSVGLEAMLVQAGGDTDDRQSLSQRMLLMTETRAVTNLTTFEELQQKVVSHYLPDHASHPHKECLYLLNDLIRYFRHMCVHYQYTLDNEPDKWLIRNIKLKHSRLVLYAGLLLTAVNASCKEDKRAYLTSQLRLTPLDRIESVYGDVKDPGFSRVTAAYEGFLRELSSKDLRGGCASTVEYNNRYDNPSYQRMRATSALLTSELTRFLLDSRSRWSRQVFEYLVF